MTGPFLPWRVVHVDLSVPVEGLAADPDIGGVLVVFWWRDLPLGRREIVSGALPVSATALQAWGAEASVPALGDRTLPHGFRQPPPELDPPPDPPPTRDALAALESPFHSAYEAVVVSDRSAPTLRTSVVVCTRDRPDDLGRCLDALGALEPPADEVVVVDNAPGVASVRNVVDRASVPNLRYVEEPRRGLSAARNAGILAATGDIVAFTDDDVEVHPRWVLRLQAAFSTPEVWAVTGLVLPAALDSEAQLLFERAEGGYGWSYRSQTFDQGFFDRTRARAVPVWQIGAGANMAFRREAFAALGGFDERLGAGTSGCSEDSEMWYRVLAAGATCHYEPSAVVFHTHRREMEAHRSQMYAYLRGHVTALLAQYERHGHLGDLRRAVLTLPWYYGKWALRRAFSRSGGPPHLRAQIRGWAAGFAYYVRHPKSPAAPAIPPRP